MQDIVIGIDATNIRAGGGLTHLIELLLNIDPMNPRIKEIIIWGTLPTILQLPTHHKVKTRSPRMLNRGLFSCTMANLLFIKCG